MGHVQWIMGQLFCRSQGHGSQAVTHCLLWRGHRGPRV